MHQIIILSILTRGVRMRKLIIFPNASLILLLLSLGSSIPGSSLQTVIENPGRPLSQNAGRVIQLKELLRIRDGGGDYYFKQPSGLDASEKGFIFYADFGEMLYKFDADGRFVKNLLRKGEGPGEIRELGQFLLKDGELFIYDGIGNKVIRKDMNGNLVSDIKFGEKLFSALISFDNDKYYLLDFKWKPFERKSGIKELDHSLYVVNQKGEVTPAPFTFPVKKSMVFRDRGASVSDVNRIQFALEDSRFLYLNHTTDYLVKILDLEKVEIVRSFMRKYDRVKFIPPKEEKKQYPEYFENLPEHHNDIQKLLIHKNNLWVLTSTIVEGKGILTDVFDREGRYLDNFYLPLFCWKPNWMGYPPAAVVGNYLYATEWDEEGNFFIVKYEIIDEGPVFLK